MKPMVALSAVFAAAAAAPSEYAAAPAVAVADIAVGQSAYSAVIPAAPYAASAPVISVPAPFTTEEVRGAPITSLSQAPPVVQKQLHFGQTQFVSGYASQIHKPALPRLNIQVPTVLKAKQTVNAPITTYVKEPFVVNEPVPVERRVEVPYDVPVLREQIEEVAVPVHVDAPYNVPYAVPVKGQTFVTHRQGPAVVQRTHENVVAPTQYDHVGHVNNIVAPAGYAGQLALPANLGYAQQVAQY